MKTKVYFTKGVGVRDFFFIPTIRYEYGDYYEKFLTLEWLWFYVGIRIEKE